jgi:hypothetical protein
MNGFTPRQNSLPPPRSISYVKEYTGTKQHNTIIQEIILSSNTIIQEIVLTSNTVIQEIVLSSNTIIQEIVLSSSCLIVCSVS